MKTHFKRKKVKGNIKFVSTHRRALIPPSSQIAFSHIKSLHTYVLRKISMNIYNIRGLPSQKVIKTSAILTINVLYLTIGTTFTSADEKNPENPTKIVTKLGVGYSDQFTISGSIGLGKVRMINARINDDASEWRIGGSWLFDFGIINFNFNRNEYDNDAHANGYSIGTFIPLSHFDIAPGGIQIFPMAGYNYTDGEVAMPDGESGNDGFILIPNTTHGAYLGALALKPLNDKWTLMCVVGGAKGTDDYSSYWFAGGMSYKITQNQSCNLYGFMSDSDYGDTQKISLSYTYEFN